MWPPLSSVSDLYMCYGYITIYILPLQRNSTVKCSIAFCALGHRRNEWAAFRCSDASLFVKCIPDTRNSSHPKQTALGPQRKCLKRKLFKRLLCIFSALFLSDLRCWHFPTLSLWLQSFSICVKFDKCPNRMCLNVILAQFFKLKDKMFYLTVGHTFQAFQL